MKQIIKIYYIENKKELEKMGGHCATGLIIELEDGRKLRHQSTDPVIGFEEIKQDGYTLKTEAPEEKKSLKDEFDKFVVPHGGGIAAGEIYLNGEKIWDFITNNFTPKNK